MKLLMNTLYTAMDRGYYIERQYITRPGNRCKHYQERGQQDSAKELKRSPPESGHDTETGSGVSGDH